MLGTMEIPSRNVPLDQTCFEWYDGPSWMLNISMEILPRACFISIFFGESLELWGEAENKFVEC